MIKRLMEKLFRLEPEVCQSCDTLRSLLEQERAERARLTQALIEVTNPISKPSIPSIVDESTPVRSNHIPWRTRRQMLETEDRERARVMKQHTKNLEEAIGINTETEDAPRTASETS